MAEFDVFLSHNSSDKPAVRRVRDTLAPYGITCWLDEDQLQPGIPWQALLEEGIRHSKSVAVFVASDGIGPWEDEEMQAALRLAVKDKRPVIPVLLPGAQRKVELPLFLGNRTWVDLRNGIDETGIERLVWGITGEKRQRVQTSANAPQWDPIVPRWNDELRIYGEGFAGRKAELAALDEAWASRRVRIFALHAEGGAGKTRVIVQWLNRMRDDGWRGAGKVFVHSFYSQGSDERRSASSELFFQHALDYFGYQGKPTTDPTEQGRALARLLAEGNGRGPGLLILDGLEPLQHPLNHPEKGRLKDPGIASLLRTLANGGGGLCMVTSRQPVVELTERSGEAVVQQPLDRLDRIAGAELLQQLGVQGPEAELRDAVDEFHGHAYTLMLLGTYLRDATDDHEIRRRFQVPLLDEDKEHRFHAQHLFGAYVTHLGEDSPEVALLRLLGFFDRAAERPLIDVLRKRRDDALTEIQAGLPNLSPAQWQRVLTRLQDLRLIAVADHHHATSATLPPIDAHPLLREYFAAQLQARFREAWQAGHERLYTHLTTTTPYRPDTLEGLQPLYQAVAHGCQAELHEHARTKVFRDRILRGTGVDGFYSVKQLGVIGADLGATACFFEQPWHTPSPNLPEPAQAWLLSQTAFYLRTLGRMTEALEPMRAGLDMMIEQETWRVAAAAAGNLSELELTLGDINSALADAERSVTFADWSGDLERRMSLRTVHADALHQAGREEEALRLFREAESLQVERQPSYPRIYSVWGFRYCDLLLAVAERAAWRILLRSQLERTPSATVESNESLKNDPEGRHPALEEESAQALTSCDEVFERADQTLRWTTHASGGLLSTALDHVTLARAGLYHELLSIGSTQPSTIPRISRLLPEIEAAVYGLRQAGTKDELPRGLLTRAWFRFVTDDQQGCLDDLAEAEEIAERGPMPPYLAEVQLTRARLFRNRTALAAAHDLLDRLQSNGYHRRDEELADAEAALLE